MISGGVSPSPIFRGGFPGNPPEIYGNWKLYYKRWSLNISINSISISNDSSSYEENDIEENK